MQWERNAHRVCKPGGATSDIQEDTDRTGSKRPRQAFFFRVNSKAGRRQGAVVKGGLGWLAYFANPNGMVMTGGFFKTRTSAMAAVRRMAEA